MSSTTDVINIPHVYHYVGFLRGFVEGPRSGSRHLLGTMATDLLLKQVNVKAGAILS